MADRRSAPGRAPAPVPRSALRRPGSRHQCDRRGHRRGRPRPIGPVLLAVRPRAGGEVFADRFDGAGLRAVLRLGRHLARVEAQALDDVGDRRNGFAVLGVVVLVVLVVPLEQTAETRSASRLPLFGRTSSLLFGALLGEFLFFGFAALGFFAGGDLVAFPLLFGGLGLALFVLGALLGGRLLLPSAPPGVAP